MFNTTNFSYNDTFKNTIISIHGIKGAQWLESLPMIIEQCIHEWNLSELKPYSPLTYNYVMSGMMNNVPIVLKLRCMPTGLEQEVAAITAYNGYGSAKILQYNATFGAIILEQAIPGTSLTSLFPHDDDHATHIAAHCIRLLHQAPIPNSSSFSTLEQILPYFKKTSTALDPFIKHAQKLKKFLLAAQQKKVLLHGDFHHGNILSSSNDQWIVIDPEGMIGDPMYDLAIYIRNPLAELIACPDATTIIRNRINTFAKILGYTPQKIYDWTYLQTVSSAYWSVEDGLDIGWHLTFLILLEKIH